MAQEPIDDAVVLNDITVQSDTIQRTYCTGKVVQPKEYIFNIGVVANASNTELAPYYIGSNNGGTITQQYSALMHASLYRPIQRQKRFSWGAGLEAWGGYNSSTGYERYKGDGQFEVQQQHPARVWIHVSLWVSAV